MTGLDSNVLVQLALQDHPANKATVTLVENEIRTGSRVVFPSFVEDEFLHVITDERRFTPPLTMIEAMNWLEKFLESPAVGLIESTNESRIQMRCWMREFKLGRKRILDTHLAAVLHTAGVRRLITSNPKDFAVFGVFDIITP